MNWDVKFTKMDQVHDRDISLKESCLTYVQSN